MFTVKDLSTLSGLSIRAIHYYDQIDLLKPAEIKPNGYRYYDTDQLLILQQILLFKELDFDLATIKKIISNSDFDLFSALVNHRQKIKKRIVRLEKIIKTIDHTLDQLKGNVEMKNEELFVGFSEEEQERYAKEAEKMYDPQTVRDSNRLWKSYTKEKQQEILRQGGENMLKMAELIDRDPGDSAVQSLVAEWHAHMQNFWSPNLDQLVGLGELYTTDDRFKINYERVKPGLADFYLRAIRVYVDRKKALLS
ncbi:MAG TPA: MerR family transcriptional regulator [Anaerolineales bacterium]|nr:MerR family transcriptional regulator [Anaerolineales bacterium]